MTITIRAKLLQTVSALRRGRDPRPWSLNRLLQLLDGTGLPVAAKARDLTAKAAKLDAEAATVGRDLDRLPDERRHAADRSRREAAKTRATALAALNGKAIENAGRKAIDTAIARVTATLDTLPEHVTDAETAIAAGPEAAAAWAAITADDRLVTDVWLALDECRRLGALAAPLVPQDFSPTTSDLAFVLNRPGSNQGGGSFALAAHRAALPEAISASTLLSDAIRRGAEPGCYDSDQARAHIEAYASRVFDPEGQYTSRTRDPDAEF